MLCFATFDAICSLVQDLPDGTFSDLKKSGDKLKGNGHAEFFVAIRNYRTWVLLLTYGYCFGVELTIDNNIAEYFSDVFGQSITAAGNLAAIFGLFNLVSRPLGNTSCSNIFTKKNL